MTTFVVSDAGGWVALGSSGLPDSGVTAGTYGDATHVGQVTVNAKGQVTAAANVPISGAGTPGLVQLFDSTLSVAAAAIDTGAGGIAAGSSDLLIRVLARTTQAALSSSLALTFNNDTGTNYEIIRMTAANGGAVSTGSAGAQTAITLTAPGASAAANLPSTVVCFVPSYTQTTFYKSVQTMGGWLDITNVGGAVDVREYNWKNTAAITRAALTAGSGNLVAGSRLTIWGMP